MAAARASSSDIEKARSTPNAAATSRSFFPVDAALNANTGANRTPLATPCGAEQNAPSGQIW